MRPAAGIQLAPDCGKHALGHVQIAADFQFVNFKRQVGWISRFNIQIVERGAFIQILGKSVGILLDSLTAQVGQVMSVEMTAGPVKQIALSAFSIACWQWKAML